MKTIISIISETPLMPADNIKDGFIWPITGKSSISALERQLGHIAGTLRSIYKEQFPLATIVFRAQNFLNVKSRSFGIVLSIEADTESLSETRLVDLIDDMKVIFDKLSKKITAISQSDSDAPLLITVKDNKQQSLMLDNHDVTNNIITVDNQNEKYLLEDLINTSRLPIDISLKLGDEVFNLSPLPVEVVDRVEGEDVTYTVYVNAIDINPFKLTIELASTKTVFGGRKISVAFHPELLKTFCDILAQSSAVKLRLSTYEIASTGKLKKLMPNAVQEIVDIIKTNSMPRPDGDMFD